MRVPRVLWYLGLAVLVAGTVYGLYLGATAEGLAALAGPVTILLAAAASLVLLTVALAWGAAGTGGSLSPWMLVVTGALSLLAAGGGLWIALDAGAWLPWAVAVAGLLCLAVTGWAWSRRPRAPVS